MGTCRYVCVESISSVHLNILHIHKCIVYVMGWICGFINILVDMAHGQQLAGSIPLVSKHIRERQKH